MIEIRKLTRPLSTYEVPRVLSNPELLKTEPTSESFDDTELVEQLEKDLSGAPFTTSSDPLYARLIHESLREVSTRLLLDPGLWQWLAIVPMQQYTLARWCSTTDPQDAESLPASQRARFLGGGSLVGVARNSIGRLYWGADAAYRTDGNYDRLPQVFEVADLFVGLFERRIGLRSDVAMAVLEPLLALEGSDLEKRRRTVLREFNMVLSTTALEALDPDDAVEIVNEIISTHQSD